MGSFLYSNQKIVHLWEKLKRVRGFRLSARSLDLENSLQKRGEGEVKVREKEGLLFFEERGRWEEDLASFYNVLYWEPSKEGFLLGHFRRQEKVFLSEICPVKEGLWEGKGVHCCKEDTYSAGLREHLSKITLTWEVRGRAKNLRIECSYF